MAWIGTPGRLIEFKCPSALVVDPVDTRRLFTSDTGAVSVTYPLNTTHPRVWQVQVDTARPGQVAALQALSLGEFGVGPFHWVPPGAPATNLLPSTVSLCRGIPGQHPLVVEAGPVLTPEGWVGRSLSTTGGTIKLGTAPVVPGVPVTGRAFTTGAGVHLRLTYADRTGAVIATHDSVATTPGAGAWVSITVPAFEHTAATVTLEAVGAAAATRPSITWTTTPRTWTPGAGSLAVSIQPLPTTVLRAPGTPGAETLTQHSFQIQEVTA